MGGIHAVTRSPEPRESRHQLVGNYQDPARPGSDFAGLVSRGHPLPGLVVRDCLGGIYGREQIIGVRLRTSPAILSSGADRQGSSALRSEIVSETGCVRLHGLQFLTF